MASLVEKISKTFIKPSSPTPQSLSRYNLSSVDQQIPPDYGSIAFFYPNPGQESVTIRHQLQNSLAKTLVSYYPFAGQLIENDHIYCNDQGVEFEEVRTHCSIFDVLKHGRSYAQDFVLPPQIYGRNKDSLVIVQLSHFDCGGVAITFSICHKVADACTVVTFMKDWAASTRLSSHVPTPLLFVAESIFPHQDGLLFESYVPAQNCVERKFVFPKAEIEKLKSKAIESGIQRPTGVEVLTAHLCQCATLAARISTNSELSRPSVIRSVINLRPFLGLSPNAVGNILSAYLCIIEDDMREFPSLIVELRKAKLKLKNLSLEELSYESQVRELEECLKNLNSSSFDVYTFTSLCGFPLYDVDFGFGKPIWVCTFQPVRVKDLIVLIDSAAGDGGIEALVTFEEEKMSAFENNEQLLPFVSLDSVKLFKSKL